MAHWPGVTRLRLAGLEVSIEGALAPLASHEPGGELCKRWREWFAECVARYSWDAGPDDRAAPTIHGLRGTGISARFASGYDIDQIANDIAAHRTTVAHYMRFGIRWRWPQPVGDVSA